MLHLLGVPVPGDMDGRVLTEILDPALSPRQTCPSAPRRWPRPPPTPHATPRAPGDSPYTAEEDAEIQQRLADLGYL